jgi:hypothetical protein
MPSAFGPRKGSKIAWSGEGGSAWLVKKSPKNCSQRGFDEGATGSGDEVTAGRPYSRILKKLLPDEFTIGWDN